MRIHVLVVAREADLRAKLGHWLAPAGYAVLSVESPQRAREAFAVGGIAASILRVARPDVAMLDLARRLREVGCKLFAIIDSGDDIGRLRRVGFVADAYLAQPLGENDVLAAMRSVGGQEDMSDGTETIEFHGMRLSVPGHSLVDASGHEIKLTRGEFAVLAALVRRPGQVLSRDRLLDAVSGRSADVFDRSIDNLIARLRRKIEPDAKRPCIILTDRGTGYKLALRQESGRARSPVRAMPHRASVLVLPFSNLDGGPELSHSARSMSIALLTELRHVVGTHVLAHHGSGSNALEIGRQLGARYIVCGSIRRSAADLRIDAQLTDAETGLPVWTDRFDGKFADLFAVEREVFSRIARAIDLELITGEGRRSLSGADGADIRDLVVHGYAGLYRPRSIENLAAARGFFERALRLNGQHADALAGLAQTHISDTMCRWSADPKAQVHLADAAASRAIEINPRLAYAYHVRGLVLRVRQQYERAIAAFDMAVQLNPSLAPAHAEFGFIKQALAGNTGGLNHALDGLAFARRISPGDPVLANWLYGVGVDFLKLGEDAGAIRWLNESIGLNPLPPALAYLAAAYALSGDETRARHALGEFRRMRPRETLWGFKRRTLADHQILPGSRVFEGLRKAGLRER
jgi:DNA-binding response OmpR family regulator/TolB-like protein